MRRKKSKEASCQCKIRENCRGGPPEVLQGLGRGEQMSHQGGDGGRLLGICWLQKGQLNWHQFDIF